MVGQIFKVIFSPIARQRLQHISNHYAQAANIATSKKVRRGIIEVAKKLENLPASKPILPNTEELDYEVRYTKAWSFKIIFRVINSKNIVRVLTIRHDREEPQDILKDV